MQQLRICMKREWWLLRQHLYPLYVRFIIVVVVALLLGSMFYDMPQTTTGIYSRGGFVFYASVVVGWVQLAELEGAMEGRGIIARHKRQAMVRPSAVAFAKVVVDLVVILAEVVVFCLIAYFMAGMRREVSLSVLFSMRLTLAGWPILCISPLLVHSRFLLHADIPTVCRVLALIRTCIAILWSNASGLHPVRRIFVSSEQPTQRCSMGWLDRGTSSLSKSAHCADLL